MGCYNMPHFVKDFACRTLVNYFNLKSMIPEYKEESIYKLNTIIKCMECYGFNTSKNYEVTLAINSMIGLLIFPEQECFDEMKKEINFIRFPKLKECIDNKLKFKNTYLYCQPNQEFDPRIVKKERICPLIILKHLRNAVAHENIMIEPISENGAEITDIKFIDSYDKKPYFMKNKYNLNEIYKYIKENITEDKENKNKILYDCRFELTIPVEKIEGVLIETANYLFDSPLI